MPCFYLLDQSLKTTGGHHFDYATRLAKAAENRGFRVVIAGHRRFRQQHAFPTQWVFERAFAHHMYSDYCAHNGWKSGPIGSAGEILPSWSPHDRDSTGTSAKTADKTESDRRKRISAFVSSCQSIFKTWPAQSGDVVFLPSMTEFDVVGLANFLRQSEWTRNVEFHVQFHFGMCEGREIEYSKHEEVFASVREQLHQALLDLGDRQLFFYATTEPLARQYTGLGVREFAPLPYPVNERLVADGAEYDRPRQLRIATPGAVREEKGQQFLTDLVNDLWHDGFSDQSLQLALQCKPKRIMGRPRQVVQLPQECDARRPRPRFLRPADTSYDPIVHCRHPLSEADYLKFITTADIGLLMYDSRRYYARHAGVMGEFLSAGIPVIAPAGCWLADQLEPSIQEYRQEIWQRLSKQADVVMRDVELLEDPCEPHARRAAVVATPGVEQFLACIATEATAESYDHLRFEFQQVDRSGGQIAIHEEIVGTHGARQMWFVVPWANNAQYVQCRISFAYHDRPLESSEITWLNKPAHTSAPCPLGAVGLVAAGPHRVPNLIREMARHYGHYRRSAAEFAVTWGRQHHPGQTLARLMQRSRQNKDDVNQSGARRVA